MSIQLDCPHCGKTLKVPDERTGPQVYCPGCKTIFQIPTPELPIAKALPKVNVDDGIEEVSPALPRQRRRDDFENDPPSRTRRRYRDDEDLPRRRKPATKTQVALFVIGGIFLFCCGGPVMLIGIIGQDSQQQGQAQNRAVDLDRPPGHHDAEVVPQGNGKEIVEKKPQPQDQRQKEPIVKPQVIQKSINRALKVGDEVRFGDSVWTVLQAQNKGNFLQSNTEFIENVRTNGKFIMVHFRITNLGTREERFLTPINLIDSKGREFTDYDNQLFFIPEGAKTLTFEAIPAGLPRQFYAIYEVPADASGFRFQARNITSTFFPQHKLVELGF